MRAERRLIARPLGVAGGAVLSVTPGPGWASFDGLAGLQNTRTGW